MLRLLGMRCLASIDLQGPPPQAAALFAEMQQRLQQQAGAASALMGTLQLVPGAVVIPLTSVSNDGSARPMVAGIAACRYAPGRSLSGRSAGMRRTVASPAVR